MLPRELEALIEECRKVWSYLENPAIASGKCADFSTRFAMLAQQMGIGGVVELQCENPRFIWETTCIRFCNHVVNMWGNTVIDWTVRQFWPNCAFPFIQPLDIFRDKWGYVYSDDLTLFVADTLPRPTY